MTEVCVPATVETYVSGILEKGRSGWDVQHTRAVVHYAQELAQAANLDPKVLVTAAWFHDIGWSTLQWNEGHETAERMAELKRLHMVNGKQLALNFLTMEDMRQNYTPAQIERIAHLVGMHDEIDLVKEKDEAVLWEADTLGQIDLTRVTPTFDYAGGVRVLHSIMNKRQPKFQTPMGKRYLEELLVPYGAFIESLKAPK